MPELPEVETVCRGLRAAIGGRRLEDVTVRRRDLRFPLPARFAARLRGRRIAAIDRRAKYMLWHMDDGAVVVGHLGMSGRMVVSTPPHPAAATHDHLIFRAEGGVEVRFNDPRRFGYFSLSDGDGLAQHPHLAALGPEPLGNGFSAGHLAERLAGRATAIKAALLDQRNVAGLGNIYVCEALYRAGISPLRPAGSLGGGELVRLVDAIRMVLDEAIAAGGSSLRDYVQTSGELGYFQHRFAVYDREGAACPACAAARKRCAVQRVVQQGRSTFFCSTRQR
ncbi:MAG: bifunctional DNA-formamidopyrimidine glycosylase/DNA-(apurinic or apyrimidinic site) lyase [Alphaproteobacteria bacterium]